MEGAVHVDPASGKRRQFIYGVISRSNEVQHATSMLG